MLRVYPTIDRNGDPVGYDGDYVYTSKNYFRMYMETEWFDDPVVVQMIEDIDETKHIKGAVFESPVLGVISPLQLSGGVKGLILIYKCFDIPRIFRSGIWGDNCNVWLSRLSFVRDFSIFFTHCLNFGAESVMAQKYTTEDWTTQDFTNGREILKYYIDNRYRPSTVGDDV